MKQRILALLLAAGLCLGLIAAAPALAFSDVSGEELSEAVEVLSGLGIVSGCSDGSYHPDDALTRAQFCKLAILTEGHGDQARGSAYRTRFSDVPGGGWAAPYINLACEEGLVAGYGDGRFGPDDPVTVGQAVTVVLRLLGYTAEEIGPFWPEDYLNKAGALGLLDGLPARERQIILLRYGLAGQPPLTQLEVAGLLNISRSYVSRLETHALELLRQRWNAPDTKTAQR